MNESSLGGAAPSSSSFGSGVISEFHAVGGVCEFINVYRLTGLQGLLAQSSLLGFESFIRFTGLRVFGACVFRAHHWV